MKSEDWILIELGAILFFLTLMGFFRVPAYEKLVWFAGGVFASAFTMVVGYKFGRSMPQQAGDAKPGQASQTDTHVTTQASDPLIVQPGIPVELPLPTPPAPTEPLARKW